MMEKKVLISLEEVKEFFKDFNKEIFAFDTETTSLEYLKLKLRGMSFCDGKKACYVDMDDNSFEENVLIIHYLSSLFINASIIIAHNSVFDLKVLRKYQIEIPDTVDLYCTMVADHLLDERRRHGLKYLAKELLGKEVVTYEEAEKASHKEFCDYAINDAVYTWELMVWQRPKLLEQSLMPLFTEIEMPFQKVIVDMETNGILVDMDKVRKTTVELVSVIEKTEVEMLECLGETYEMQVDLVGGAEIKSSINFGSSQQLADILFKRLKLTPVEITPSGAASVGKKTIDTLKTSHPFIKLLAKFKIAKKLLNAFFAPMPKHVGEDGRVRPSFNGTGTKTGRLSCSKPNLQQLPKINKDLPIDTRGCFIVPKGKKMIACDYSGQELRVLTQVSQEPVLIDTFNKGKDMHLSTANDFFELNIPEEELYSSNPKCEEHKKRFKDERNKAKVINFGMAYGKGAYGFSKDFGISEDEAQKILDKYFAALPKVKQAIDDCHRQVRAKGYVTSMVERRRRFTPKNGTSYYPASAFRESFNFLIQGFSADMIKKAMVNVRKLQDGKPMWEIKTIATVHDEAVYEVNEEYAEEAAKQIKQTFEDAVKFVIPVVADVSVGDNYGEVK